MRKLILLFVFGIVASLSMAQKNITVEYQESSTRNLEPEHYMVTAPLIADIKVTAEKITYTETEAFRKFPITADNIKDIKTAMPEFKKIALSRAAKAHNADLLVGTIIDVTTDVGGFICITVSGYPAKYVNFRNATSQEMDIVRSARIATYDQDNLEILYPQTNTNVKIKELLLSGKHVTKSVITHFFV